MNIKYDKDIMTIKDASIWASKYLNKNVSVSNISYLIQYSIIRKVLHNNTVYIYMSELKNYYDINNKKINYENNLDIDLNWNLAFDNLKETDTTKHVHRLHPYKGKFIPQLVEYFIDSHIDEYKKEIFFSKNDIILDPFCGSGTTLVQANELGIHSIGVDISIFNTMISNSKVLKVDLELLNIEICKITEELYCFSSHSKDFDKELEHELNNFNFKYFTSIDFKRKVREKTIDVNKYSLEKEEKFLSVYNNLIKKYNIELFNCDNISFLSKWFIPNIISELNFVNTLINKVDNESIKNVLFVILSRTMRSCRATTHSDLATLLSPVKFPYYCRKHYKICKPIFSILKWWKQYSKDTIKRLDFFSKIRTNTEQLCLCSDSRSIDILEEVKLRNHNLYSILLKNKVKGIFTSPPYLGLIDYHEQHAYSYELFNLNRKDSFEIGSLSNGNNSNAKQQYINDIVDVLLNSKKYMVKDYNVFIVANDKYNLYPEIAQKSGMKIVNIFKRPVLNRVEKDRSFYYENIFHLKEL